MVPTGEPDAALQLLPVEPAPEPALPFTFMVHHCILGSPGPRVLRLGVAGTPWVLTTSSSEPRGYQLGEAKGRKTKTVRRLPK